MAAPETQTRADTGADTAFAQLMAHERRTRALEEVAGRLGWDQETVMPRAAVAQRADETAALSAVIHARRTDPRIPEWLQAARDAGAEADPVAAACLREIARAHDRHARVPETLATALARRTALAQGEWAAARAEGDSAAFVPVLDEVLRLKREEAAALAQDGDPYDALLDLFEPGTTASFYDDLFAALRPRLAALAARCLDGPPAPVPQGRFAGDAQLRLARDLAARFGYDFERGRLDLAVHPFSSGSGADVRITTRVDEGDPFNCLYSTLHETGHACYEQAVAPEFALGPLGRGASMGVHESQSRLYENQLGRSRAFCGWLWGAMRDAFGAASGLADARALWRAVNRVHPGFIRTEADEVHYNLHIMLRYDLERAMIRGELEARDVEAAWNARFAADFGRTPPDPGQGWLQDVHWSVGLMGYFPTYALGNVYAGCLHAALIRAVPDLDQRLAAGDPGAATAWLRAHVQRHGEFHSPRDLIAQATGAPPDATQLLSYLEAKFSALCVG